MWIIMHLLILMNLRTGWKMKMEMELHGRLISSNVLKQLVIGLLVNYINKVVLRQREATKSTMIIQ